MAHKGMTVVRAPAASLEAAHEIAGCLSQAGFARNSIEVERLDAESLEVRLHVREANRRKAEDAIANGLGGLPVGRLLPSGTALVLGIGAAAIGAGVYAALTARKMIPRYLHESAREPASAPMEE